MRPIISLIITSLATVLWPTLVVGGPPGVPDPCQSTTAILSGGIPGAPGTVFICPAGDGQTLADVGVSIVVAVRDCEGAGIALIPGADLWLDGCFVPLGLWALSASSNADGLTDAAGMITFETTTIQGGGFSDDVSVIIQGNPIQTFDCSSVLCLPLAVRSADIDGDLTVGLVDVALFASGFPSPPNPFEPPFDFNDDATVNLVDLAIFSGHMGHTCP